MGKTVKVEIIDEKRNKNLIPVVVNVGYGDSLLVYGLSYRDGDLKSIVTLHHGTKNLVQQIQKFNS